MCNFRPFNAHIQIFSYVFLNFPQQILHLPKFIQCNRRAVRLKPGCPVITMRLPYLIRYEVLNVITMWCPYFIRYKVLCHCERKYGDPAGYCVPVGKRNKQAKDKQLTFTAIVWSKAQFMTYRPEGNPYCNDIKHFVPNEIR